MHALPAPRASRQSAIVAVLALSGLCASLTFTLVVPIQAQLPELLNASREDTAWVLTATLLSGAVSTPISGRLGDMYGKRRTILILISSLIVGSVVAALSVSLVGVVIGRTLQGLVVGVIPLGISLMRDALAPERLSAAVALMSATLGVGGAISLPLSAGIVQLADWHVLFWMTAILGAVFIALILWVVPEGPYDRRGRLDIVGAVGLAVGVGGILIALSRGAEWGWGSPALWIAGPGCALLLLAWGRYELRHANPLLDLRAAARPTVLLTNVASVGLGFALFASNVAYPQMLELPTSAGGFGLTVMLASLVVMPSGIMMMLVSPLSGRLARTFGPKTLLIAGCGFLLAAYAYTLMYSSEVWHLLVANVLVGLGIGFGYAAMPLLIMRAVPASETGEANGVNALARSLGTSLAASVTAAVLAASAVDVGGVSAPTPAGFHLAFVIAGGAAAVAMAVAALIPRPPLAHGLRVAPQGA